MTGILAAKAAGIKVIVAVPLTPEGQTGPSAQLIKDLRKAGADVVLNDWRAVNEFIIKNAFELTREGELSPAFPIHRFIREGRNINDLSIQNSYSRELFMSLIPSFPHGPRPETGHI